MRYLIFPTIRISPSVPIQFFFRFISKLVAERKNEKVLQLTLGLEGGWDGQRRVGKEN